MGMTWSRSSRFLPSADIEKYDHAISWNCMLSISLQFDLLCNNLIQTIYLENMSRFENKPWKVHQPHFDTSDMWWKLGSSTRQNFCCWCFSKCGADELIIMPWLLHQIKLFLSIQPTLTYHGHEINKNLEEFFHLDDWEFCYSFAYNRKSWIE